MHLTINKIILLGRSFSHVNWALADQAIVSGVNFLTGLLIARFLGIESFGVFTLVWMAVLFVNSIQMAIISAPMMTIGPKQSENERPSYYGAVVMHQAIFSTLTSSLLWVGLRFSDLINPNWQVTHLALPLAMSLFFFQNQDFLRRLLFTENCPGLALMSDIISYLGRIIILVLFFLYGTITTSYVLWIIAMSSALALTVGISQNKMVFDSKKLLPVFKRHWILSKWMTASALLQWTSAQYFILAAGGLLGPVAVGALKAAQNIIGISNILFQGLENIVPATASRCFKNKGAKGLKIYLFKVSLWGGAATLALAVAVSLFPNKILVLVFGEAYNGYGHILRLYSIYYIVSFFSLPLRSGLRVLDYTRPIFISYLIMSLFSILLANTFIKYGGLEGAMGGMIITVSLSTACLLVFFIKRINSYNELAQ